MSAIGVHANNQNQSHRSRLVHLIHCPKQQDHGNKAPLIYRRVFIVSKIWHHNGSDWLAEKYGTLYPTYRDYVSQPTGLPDTKTHVQARTHTKNHCIWLRKYLHPTGNKGRIMYIILLIIPKMAWKLYCKWFSCCTTTPIMCSTECPRWRQITDTTPSTAAFRCPNNVSQLLTHSWLRFKKSDMR